MKNLKLFEQFLLEMTQDEFNVFHDKFYAEGNKQAKIYYDKNPEEYKADRMAQDNKNSVYHNYAVMYLLVKLGEKLGIPRDKDMSDSEYSYKVEDDKRVDKFFNVYINNIKKD